MNKFTRVKLHLPKGLRGRAPFFVLCKTEYDAPDHPYGQWTLGCGFVCLPPVEENVFLANVAFVAPKAPHHALTEGKALELYYGTSLIGYLYTTEISDNQPTNGFSL